MADFKAVLPGGGRYFGGRFAFFWMMLIGFFETSVGTLSSFVVSGSRRPSWCGLPPTIVALTYLLAALNITARTRCVKALSVD